MCMSRSVRWRRVRVIFACDLWLRSLRPIMNVAKPQPRIINLIAVSYIHAAVLQLCTFDPSYPLACWMDGQDTSCCVCVFCPMCGSDMWLGLLCHDVHILAFVVPAKSTM